MYEQEAWKRANWKGYAEHINRVAKVVRTKEQPCSCCDGTEVSKHVRLHLISQRPILVRRAWRGHFEIVEARQDSHSQPGIRLTPAVKILVGRVIAISRTPPWLLSGWGCLDRRLSRG